MNSTKVPAGFEDIAKRLKETHERILGYLSKRYAIEPYPDVPKLKSLDGEGAAIAYPIQGILKYHGMCDWDSRTAYFPSVSVNNDAVTSVTYVKFDTVLEEDYAVVNGKLAAGRDLERVKQTLDFIRNSTGASTRAYVFSKNIVRLNRTGKGLGTSASGSAALALAAIEAGLGKKYSSNLRFATTVSRYLAGSGCRSTVGGLSLWLSYPGIQHKDSFAIRLDDKNQFDDVSLITVPIDTRIGLKTEDAHRDAPNSPLYKAWLESREKYLFDLFQAVEDVDWETIGQLAEKDTHLLHGITSSAGNKYKIIAFEPETIHLMRSANEMRKKGIPVYYSVDTGPTPVFITHDRYADEVIEHINSIGFEGNVIKGKIAGPANIISKIEAENLLGTDLHLS